MPLTDLTTAPLPRLPARHADSHKGDYGRALLIGGSRGMSGAIALAGLAALRSGAGLVTLAVPRSIQDVVAGASPCFMTLALADDGRFVNAASSGDVLAAATSMTAVALGPGLGRTPSVTDFVTRIYCEVSAPLVVDADALFALAEAGMPPAAAGPRILTPHPGEFARLTGKRVDGAERVDAAAELARDWKSKASGGLVIVLKGHETVVTDGARVSVNQTGNPGMATGGTGDVLTGVITALLCQGLSPFDAARLGVHVHGLAGDLAARALGQVSLIASDVIDFLPAAFRQLAEQCEDASS